MDDTDTLPDDTSPDDTSPDDPRGLIREAYRIEGISAPDCRSIFFDWALGLPAGSDMRLAAARLLARHGASAPGHPMTLILREAGAEGAAGARRGGRRGRTGTGGA
jgi:hypothetical protein